MFFYEIGIPTQILTLMLKSHLICFAHDFGCLVHYDIVFNKCFLFPLNYERILYRSYF